MGHYRWAQLGFYLHVTPPRGEKLHALWLQHGDMDEVNVLVERLAIQEMCPAEYTHPTATQQENEEKVEGGWFTKLMLETKPGWTEFEA